MIKICKKAASVFLYYVRADLDIERSQTQSLQEKASCRRTAMYST